MACGELWRAGHMSVVNLEDRQEHLTTLALCRQGILAGRGIPYNTMDSVQQCRGFGKLGWIRYRRLDSERLLDSVLLSDSLLAQCGGFGTKACPGLPCLALPDEGGGLNSSL